MIYYIRNTEEDLEHMRTLHRNITGKRHSNFQNTQFSDKSNNKFPLILRRVKNLLDSYNITNYDIDKYHIEFQQRNCSGEKKYNSFRWHRDDYGAVSYKCWSIIFYLRKDKGINGGHFIYKTNNNIYKHNVNGGDIILFRGDLYHKPEISNGFGCRDAIVVFVKRL